MTESALRSPTVADAEPLQAPAERGVDAPGRWLGGFIGGALSLAFALMAPLVGEPSDAFVDFGMWQWVGLLGIPVGFIIGRAFLPAARSADWRHAAVVGIGLGWLAPPLGAPLAVSFFAGDGWVCDPTRIVAVAIAILPFAVVISFIAVIVTIPIGIVWGSRRSTRSPSEWLSLARVPAPDRPARRAPPAPGGRDRPGHRRDRRRRPPPALGPSRDPRSADRCSWSVRWWSSRCCSVSCRRWASTPPIGALRLATAMSFPAGVALAAAFAFEPGALAAVLAVPWVAVAGIGALARARGSSCAAARRLGVAPWSTARDVGGARLSRHRRHECAGRVCRRAAVWLRPGHRPARRPSTSRSPDLASCSSAGSRIEPFLERSSASLIAALVVGMPVTAVGFLGIPVAAWLGAMLVAGGGARYRRRAPARERRPSVAGGYVARPPRRRRPAGLDAVSRRLRHRRVRRGELARPTNDGAHPWRAQRPGRGPAWRHRVESQIARNRAYREHHGVMIDARAAPPALPQSGWARSVSSRAVAVSSVSPGSWATRLAQPIPIPEGITQLEARLAGDARPLHEVDGGDLVGLGQEDPEAGRLDARAGVAGPCLVRECSTDTGQDAHRATSRPHVAATGSMPSTSTRTMVAGCL